MLIIEVKSLGVNVDNNFSFLTPLHIATTVANSIKRTIIKIVK